MYYIFFSHQENYDSEKTCPKLQQYTNLMNSSNIFNINTNVFCLAV